MGSGALWITAVQFDESGVLDHQHLRRVHWRTAAGSEEGESTVEEMIESIRHHRLVYVSDDLFDRSAVVRVVDADPPFIRAWARGDWGNDLLALPQFGG